MKLEVISAACIATALLAAAASAAAQTTATADSGESGGAGPASSPRPFEAFTAWTGVDLFGFLQFGYSRNNRSTHDQASGGYSNLPVIGPNDEGLQINALQLAFEKKMTSNLLPRVTPLPGPVPWEYSWGFRGEILYGRNGLPAAQQGLETKWGFNKTADGVSPGANRQNYLALPQLYAEFYAPWASGVTLIAGRFGSGIGYEIAPQWRPGPDFFYSRTYAFVSQPDQVKGVLLSANLMRNDLGFLAGELGVVNGRQNWKDNNGDKSYIGALRWRSVDMQTWVDYSFMAGNEQTDPGATSQVPVARVTSPRGQLRQHHSLSVTLNPADAWQVHGELLYGRQAGDGQADTVDLLSGPSYTGGSYSGANAQVLYRTSPSLQYGARIETFRDLKGTALFPVTAVPGVFNATTLGLKYDVTRSAVLRPEIRYDWQTRNHGVKAFGSGTATNQLTVSADLILYF